MNIYFYFTLNEEVDIAKLEKKIKDILADNGEITGSGRSLVARNGSIDVELFDETTLESFLVELQKNDFPRDTVYFIGDMKKHLFDNKEVK